MEDPSVRGHPQEPAENQIGDAECLLAGDDCLEPVAEAAMVSDVFAVSVQQDVDVGENHDRPPSPRAKQRYCRGQYPDECLARGTWVSSGSSAFAACLGESVTRGVHPRSPR